MTQQDDITQRVPMAEEILGAIRSAGYRDHPTNIERKRVDAILGAVEPLLSKLRAPVADERVSDDTLWSWAEQIMGGKEAHHVGRDRVLRFARAALASAPVAETHLEWSAKALYDAIKDVLLNHRLSNWVDGDGEFFPLVDHLCSKDATTTESGEHEIALICDAIYNDALTKSAPVAGEAHTALNEWFDKTDFIQKRIASGELPVKYLGWHRADVMRDLIDTAARNQVLPSGCIVVQEADTIPHTHPEYGPGIFFTEDARIEFDAAPQASEEYTYARNLAVTMWEKRFKQDAPEWKPCEDLIGVLTQIDNMVAGLVVPQASEAVRSYTLDEVFGPLEALEIARSALMEIADLADVEADQRGVIVNRALTKIDKLTAAALSAQPGAQKNGGRNA